MMDAVRVCVAMGMRPRGLLDASACAGREIIGEICFGCCRDLVTGSHARRSKVPSGTRPRPRPRFYGLTQLPLPGVVLVQ